MELYVSRIRKAYSVRRGRRLPPTSRTRDLWDIVYFLVTLPLSNSGASTFEQIGSIAEQTLSSCYASMSSILVTNEASPRQQNRVTRFGEVSPSGSLFTLSSIFEKYSSGPHYYYHRCNFDKKTGSATFWAIFSPTHLVTLLANREMEANKRRLFMARLATLPLAIHLLILLISINKTSPPL
jgi:hypothetical protein